MQLLEYAVASMNRDFHLRRGFALISRHRAHFGGLVLTTVVGNIIIMVKQLVILLQCTKACKLCFETTNLNKDQKGILYGQDAHLCKTLWPLTFQTEMVITPFESWPF